jgi:hypothetical protein
LPNRSEYGSVIIRRDGPLFVDAELAYSKVDRNIISSIDGLKTGVGFYGQSGWRIKDKSGLGKTWNGDIIELKFRSLDSKFDCPVYQSVEFSRQYNLPELYSPHPANL